MDMAYICSDVNPSRNPRLGQNEALRGEGQTLDKQEAKRHR